MKRTKILALVTSIIMLLALAVGCSSSPQETAAASESNGTETAQAAETESAATTESAEQSEAAVSGEKLVVGLQIHFLNNQYQVQLSEGAKKFVEDLQADGVNAELQVLTSEGDDQVEIDGIKALVASGGANTILFIDPNQAANAAVVADIFEQCGGYWSSCWSTAEGVYPGQYPHYAFFQSPDNVKMGDEIATQMFDSFDTPGTGKILVLQGELANTAEINRYAGLQEALEKYPNIEVLDTQTAEWATDKALTITETWLSKYDDIDGIWCANDNMAIGALQALDAKGLKGQIKVVGIDAVEDCIADVKDGSMVATVSADGFSQAYYGLAYAYAAYTGAFDPVTAGPDKTMVLTDSVLITKDTVDDFEASLTTAPSYDYKDLNAKYIIGSMEIPADY